MENERAIELLKIEKAYIIRQIPTPPTCDRECADCEIVQKTDELLQAYDLAIEALGSNLVEHNLARDAYERGYAKGQLEGIKTLTDELFRRLKEGGNK